MNEILDFVHLCEKLKLEKRRSRTSKNLQESVADHCWRLSLMVLVFYRYLDKRFSLEKALKIAIIHDLAEILTGDIPCCITDLDPNLLKIKKDREGEAIEKILNTLPEKVYGDIKSLWEEYEKGETYESKVVKALDKIEGQIQFNEGKFSFWNQYDIENANKKLNKYCEFDDFIGRVRVKVQEESLRKISTHDKIKN